MKPKMLAFASLATAVATVNAAPVDLELRDTSSCPYYLQDGGYEFPHLIVPINNSNIAMGHSYFAEITPGDCATIFNFDIPPSRADQQCSVYFTLPYHDQLTTSDFKYNGNNTGNESSGTFQLVQYKYGTGATNATTGDLQPPLGPDPAIQLTNVGPGRFYKAWTGSCGAGGIMSWRMSSYDSWLIYFQDWNSCAIGLWVVYEDPPPPA